MDLKVHRRNLKLESVMIAEDPIITVIVFSALAAGMAGLGPLPFALFRQVSAYWVGTAYALASGLMLGVGYLLLFEGIARAPMLATIGFTGGAVYTFWTQAYSGTDEIQLAPSKDVQLVEGYKLILRDALHSAAEGVAIGVCMFVNLRFGIFTAFSLAIHNVGEAMALTDILRKRKIPLREAVGLCMVTNVTQILMAIVAFAVSPALGFAFPVAVGFAAGGIVFLIMTESLPASYQHANSSVIAFMVSLAAGSVVLLDDLLL
jgi:ZIP family zinc transporter